MSLGLSSDSWILARGYGCDRCRKRLGTGKRLKSLDLRLLALVPKHTAEHAFRHGNLLAEHPASSRVNLTRQPKPDKERGRMSPLRQRVGAGKRPVPAAGLVCATPRKGAAGAVTTR